MFAPVKLKKCLLPCIVSLSGLFAQSAMADPVILPPGELSNVPPVFCFKVTGGDVLAGGGARIQFEVLNWTGEDAYFVQVTQNPFSEVNTGGSFSPVIPAPTNGWHVLNDPFGGELGNSALFSANQGDPFGDFGLADVPQNPLQGIDLDPNNDLDFSDAPALPTPVDSGINALDGFILDFPDFDIYERVVLQWSLLNQDFSPVDTTTVLNPFSFGTFQIDRASNGSIRVATYFSIGTSLFDIDPSAPPLDQAATEANAVTLPATSLSAVPVPAAAWLFISGLFGMVGVSRYRKTASQV